MLIKLYEDLVKIKGTNIIGILIDEQYRTDKKMNLYVLEENKRDKDGRFPLHDVWENEIERIDNKIKVYQSATDEYIEMKVLARFKYIGETKTLAFTKNKIYDCVGFEESELRIVDDTGEDYLFLPDKFELIEDFRRDS